MAALLVGAALTLAGCGGGGDAPPTAPVTFTATSTLPTSTIATPTAKAYVGPDNLPIETGPFLAPATTTALGGIVRGIQCEPLAQLAYASYAHLQVYVSGRSRALPGGIGIVGLSPRLSVHGLYYGASTCMYWLHTRAADGLIDVESPVRRQFTLGDLFAIWRQPLSGRRVAGTRGPVTAIVDGRRWRRDPAAIPLREHTDIELAVGRPIPRPVPVDWVATRF